MSDTIQFSNIQFDLTTLLPSYPRVIDPTQTLGAHVDPALKIPKDEDFQPFTIVLTIDPANPAVFAGTDGPYVLRNPAGAVITEPRWTAMRSARGKTCVVSWDASTPPSQTMALRFDCVVEEQRLACLYLGVVKPQHEEPRKADLARLPPIENPVLVQMSADPDQPQLLVFDLFDEQARRAVESLRLKLEPAFRIPDGERLQIKVLLPEGCAFAPPPPSNVTEDQVGVTLLYPGSPLGSGCLKPTLMPDERTCIATAERMARERHPPERFLCFNLKLANTDSSGKSIWRHHRRVDPMMIQDPYITP